MDPIAVRLEILTTFGDKTSFDVLETMTKFVLNGEVPKVKKKDKKND